MAYPRSARRWLAAAWLVLAALCAPLACARTVLELDADKQPVALEDWGDAWLDPTGEASVQGVAANPAIDWAATRHGAIYPLNTHRTLWVRFTVPPAPDAERWYLEVPYPSVNRVTLYTRDSTGQWVGQSAGDTIPVENWPVPHRHPLLPLVVSAEEPRAYYLRVENPHSFSAPLSFVSESYLMRHEQRTSFILGIYFGLAALAATLAVLSAVSLRDSAYAWYGLTVALMGVTQASMTGIGGLHLWAGAPWWNDVSSLTLPVVASGALLLFLSSVISLPQRSRRLHTGVLAVSALSLVAAAGVMLAEPSYRFKIMVPYIVLAVSVGLGTVVWAWRRGDRYAKWLLCGMVPVGIGAAFPLARTAGLIPVSTFTMHAMQVGIAIELPILLVILMLRSQQRREHRRRMVALERIDPATGLINEAVFHERMVQMIARSVRLKVRGSVLLIDIVNAEQIERDYDRRSAEELPLRVAGRLLHAAREIDSVGRLGDWRFGMLLEGPQTASDVAEAGPRVVARCLMPFKNKPLDWVAQVRVAQALVPMDGTDADEVMARLEEVLATVPADSRRAVFPVARPPLAEPAVFAR